MKEVSRTLCSGAAALVLAGLAPPVVSAQAATVPSLIFDSVTVVDVEQGELIQNQRVVIAGHRIQAVGDINTVGVPPGTRVVDAKNKYLIPGLWDMHAHSRHSYADIYYPLFLVYGVTGIRDPNSDIPLETLVQWRQEVLTGRRVGPPRQILSGLNLNEIRLPQANGIEIGPPVDRVLTLADVPWVVDSLKAAGADMLKMYALSHSLYFAIAAEARRQGIQFGGHLDIELAGERHSFFPDLGPSALEASDSGASIIDHVNTSAELSSSCLGMYDETRANRCRLLAERFQRNNTWWVPTLVSSIYSKSLLPFPLRVRTRAATARMVQVSRAFWQDSELAWEGAPAGGIITDSSETGTALALVRQAGVPMLAGTDVSVDGRGNFPGLALHTELEIFVAEGLTPLDALRAATINPAKMLCGTDSLGTVAPGKLADLVLLDANPLADIANTTKIRAVIANGRYYDRAALDRLLVEAKAKAKGKP